MKGIKVKLIALANKLDAKGLHQFADEVDRIMKEAAGELSFVKTGWAGDGEYQDDGFLFNMAADEENTASRWYVAKVNIEGLKLTPEQKAWIRSSIPAEEFAQALAKGHEAAKLLQ